MLGQGQLQLCSDWLPLITNHIKINYQTLIAYPWDPAANSASFCASSSPASFRWRWNCRRGYCRSWRGSRPGCRRPSRRPTRSRCACGAGSPGSSCASPPAPRPSWSSRGACPSRSTWWCGTACTFCAWPCWPRRRCCWSSGRGAGRLKERERVFKSGLYR